MKMLDTIYFTLFYVIYFICNEFFYRSTIITSGKVRRNFITLHVHGSKLNNVIDCRLCPAPVILYQHLTRQKILDYIKLSKSQRTISNVVKMEKSL